MNRRIYYEKRQQHSWTERLLRLQTIAQERPKEGYILDIGGHEGTLNKFLRYSYYVCVDISTTALKKGRGFRVLADAYHLPFKQKVFSGVYCLELLEHLFFPRKCLREIKRVLRTDGYLVVSVPNFSEPYNRILVLLGRPPAHIGCDERFAHIRVFTPRTIKEILTEEGFVIKKQLKGYVQLLLRRLWAKLGFEGGYTYKFGRLGIFNNYMRRLIYKCEVANY